MLTRNGADGSGGGVSAIEPLPSFQATVLGKVARGRVTPDVALVGNPTTGVAVYSTFGDGAGWIKVGGTSVGAPIWAALIARADQARGAHQRGPLSSAQTLNLLYSSYATNYGAFFHDIAVGRNLAGPAKPGHDQVTGLGSPIANDLIDAAATFDGSAPAPAAAPAAPGPRRVRRPLPRPHPRPHPTPRRRPREVEFFAPTLDVPVALTVTAPAVPVTLGPLPGSGTPVAPVQPLTTASDAVPALRSLARPRQPVAQSSDMWLEEKPEAPKPSQPVGPDLFIDPIIEPNLKLAAPQIAFSSTHPAPRRALALDQLEGDTPLSGTDYFSPISAPVIEPEENASTLGSAAAAGIAIAVWSRWESDSRRSSTDRRRWSFPLETPPR
jgi:hypothetical protein